MTHRRMCWRFLAVAAALVVALTGCGVLVKQSPSEHNAADVVFGYRMLPHHEQAVRMADMVPGHDASSQVQQLAAKIKTEQQPEIGQLTAMLRSWGTRAAEMPKRNDQAPAHMPGMMSDAQLAALENARGPAFDRQFLTMMIAHHQGAVDMANEELQQGLNGQALDLARSILQNQRAEIEQMRGMLAAS
jgi:uncharacterized protein (DUF305 family)